MNRILTVLGLVGAAVVALIALVIVGISFLVDPNDYKAEIAAAVEQATGRQFSINGDLELDIFPRVRIAFGSAELANAPGFGTEPFAQIGSGGLSVGLFPLLARRIEVDEARLEGLVLNLARNAQGANNWQDMGGDTVEVDDNAGADETLGGSDLALDIGAVVIADAEVNWSDAAAGSNWRLGDFNLNVEGLGGDRAFPMTLGFSLSGDDVDLTVETSMDVTLGLSANQYRFDRLEVALDGEGAAWPGGQGEIDLSFDSLAADLQAETLDLEGLVLELLGLRITGALAGTELFDNLTLAGAIEFAEFEPRDLLDVLNVELETADPDVLQSAEISAQFAYDSEQMMLESLQLEFDDSLFAGRLGMVGNGLSFDLSIDSINIDRYLPPASEETVEDEGSLDEVDLPLQMLESFNADGQLAIGAAQFSGLAFTDAVIAVNAADGMVSLVSSASLYGGTLDSAIVVDVGETAADLSITQELAGIDVFSLGQSLMDMDALSGTVDTSMSLVASGANLGDVRRQLNGDVDFALTDGAWDGVDMWFELRRARAVFDSAPMPVQDGEPRTPFSEVSASGVIADGVLTNRDFIADLGFINLTGGGTVSLLTEALDFDLVAAFVDGPMLQSDPEMADLAGDDMPLTVGGTLSSPSVLPDFGGMIRAEVESAVEEAVEEERQELEDRLENSLRGILDR